MKVTYKIVVSEIDNVGGYGQLAAESGTTHHTGVETVAPYDIIGRLKLYSKHHGGRFPYHFYIPIDNNDGNVTDAESVIYVTQYLDQFTVHNANYTGNRKALAIVLEGNFQVQKPTELQLALYRQLLEDLESGRLWKELGYTDAFKNFKPKSNKVFTYEGVSVYANHYHNEVAQPGNGTACCGVNFIPYILDWRAKQGNVTWGNLEDKNNMEIENLKKQINDLKVQLDSANRDKAIAVAAQNVLSGENKSLRDKVAQLESAVKNLITPETHSQAISTALEAQTKALTEEWNKKENQISEEYSRMNTQLNNFKDENERLKSELTSYRQKDWRTTALNSFEKWFMKSWDNLGWVSKYILPNSGHIINILTILISLLGYWQFNVELAGGISITNEVLKSLFIGWQRQLKEKALNNPE